MSLLMDALKKAEKEKKEAAKRRREAEVEKPEGETSTAEPAATAETPEATPASAEDVPIGASVDDLPGEEEGTRLGLEPMEAEAEDTALGPEGSHDPEKTTELAADTMALEGSAAPYDNEDGRTDPEMHLLGENSYDQVSTLPSQRAVRSSLEGYFDATGSFERTVTGETGIGARGIGPGVSEQPTPVAAQTVFTAAGTSASGSGLKWGAFTGLVLVAVLAGSVIYYLMVTPIARDVPSPLVAKGIESPLPVQAVAEPPIGEVVVPAPDVEMASEAEVETVTSVPTRPEVAVGTPPQTLRTEPEVKVAPISRFAAQAPAPMSGEGESLMSPGQFVVEPRQIKITRSRSPDRVASLVTSAYQAYLAGNYPQAAAGYREILSAEPENRNALLGLGAIATHHGDLQIAYRIYRQLLTLNPKDTVAQAAMLNLRGSGSDPVLVQSRVKLLIAENPGAPYLKFDLGNAYARQLRWAEAQGAYFDAYSADSTNSDYALNLAVSLDHLGQSKSALTYYHRALELAGRDSVNFNNTAVKSRITSLSAAVTTE
jgi:Flp pilus assembly protein TadD